MEWLFRRHFWIVQLAFLALAAIVLAIATNMFVEHLLVTGAASEKRPGLISQTKSLMRNFDIVNERNLFQAKREKPEKEEAAGSCDEYWAAEKSQATLRLVGTMIANDPSRSIAVIEDQKQPLSGAKAYTINECTESSRGDMSSFGSSKEPMPSGDSEACNNMSGAGEIKRIDSECVYFYNPSSRHCEFLSLFNAKCNLSGDEIPKKPPTPTPPTPSASTDELGKSIKQVGPSSYEIDRSDLDNIMNNLAKLMAQARVVPEQSDGKTAWRFTMIQPNSALSKLGFQVGDTITKINGYEPEAQKMGEFLGRLHTDSQFNVEGRRGSGSFTFEYNVKR